MRLTVVLMALPDPEAAPQLDPPVAVHVQVTLARPAVPAGTVSVTVAPVAALGPLFLTVIV